jgi:DNA-binding response OmpR family regulator
MSSEAVCMAGEKILVVEDQLELLEPLRFRLEAEGYEVCVAADGLTALDEFEARQPDLVLLDMMLPKLDGLTVCGRLRSRSQVPILILSAKAEEANIVAALEVGADDYVPKPFRINEVVARIRALLRRAEPQDVASTGLAPRSPLNVGAVTIDPGRCEVRVRGRVVPLTPTEYRMLLALAQRNGEVVSREDLLSVVWGYQGYDVGLVNTHVKRLRGRIEQDPAVPRILLTVRGFGYRLNADAGDREPDLEPSR